MNCFTKHHHLLHVSCYCQTYQVPPFGKENTTLVLLYDLTNIFVDIVVCGVGVLCIKTLQFACTH
uniref:Predicted protein n=1 Tax=Hordeum vulgare subsp. vulgare TaxID=112509 RepID=F2DWH6_HORVV|nr:predicted protein [Hordeum vulgare subsp. vulgare]